MIAELLLFSAECEVLSSSVMREGTEIMLPEAFFDWDLQGIAV